MTSFCKTVIAVLCLFIFSLSCNVIQAQGNPNQLTPPSSKWKINGNNSSANDYLGTNNQRDLILKSNALEVLRLTTDQETKIKGDFYLEQEIDPLDPLPKFMMVGPNGRVRGVTKSFLLNTIYGGPGCQYTGEEYDSPIWKSISFSENYGYLITGNDCPARVGIGVENPATQLHVNGGGYFTSNVGVGSAPVFETQLNAKTIKKNGICIDQHYIHDYGYAYKAIVHKKNTKGLGIFNEGYQHDVFTVYGSGTIEASNEQDTYFSLRPEGYMEISNESGNIFTLEPDGKFILSNGTDKLLQLESDGLLRSRKIKVDQNNWAEYVFDMEYSLMPLKELEEYISTHKHLPRVPSQQTVLSEGVDLGEMNVILLEKIEELTLYVIEQNKEMESLKEDLENFKSLVTDDH